MQKHIREAVSALQDMGCQNVKVETGRGHVRLRFEYEGRSAFIVAASTPRTDRSASWAVQDARRILGLPSSGPGERKKRRPKVVHEEVIRAPKITTKPDPMEALRDHARFSEVTRLRYHRLFEELFEDACMRLYGVPTVLEHVLRLEKMR